MTSRVRFGVCAEEKMAVTELLEVMEARVEVKGVESGLFEARYPDGRLPFTPGFLQPPPPPPLPPRPERVRTRQPTQLARLRQLTHTRAV